jgi:redox-sensitive bicupin YhaK (pirin superfamily)
MLTIRKSGERGHANHGWLDTNYTFSFANYYDPKHMGFRALRVINDDRIAPGRGFGAHPHEDMEILTYVIQGRLAHKDSMGHQEEIGPNEVQYMSAGTGITHSEFNPSAKEPLHLLQIWIEPKSNGATPNYGQFSFAAEEKQNKLKLLASGEAQPGAARIHQDAKVYVTELTEGTELGYELGKTRHAWVHVIQGKVELNGQVLSTGDAAAVSGESSLALRGLAREKSEVLIFDLA